jgi:hypothetical protein
MAVDLESLRAEIQAYLDDSEIAVFKGYRPVPDALDHVSWDTVHYPDFKEFVKVAHKAGAKLIVFHHRALSLEQIDEALDRLEEGNFTGEEKRNYQSRLKQLKAYEGFTCSVELSFSIEGHTYFFELRTDWYDALNDIVAELDAAEEEEEDDSGLGGYFSNN